MSPQDRKKCNMLVGCYQQTVDEETKLKIRDELFDLMYIDLQRWIKTQMRKMNQYRDEDHIISWTWDAFLYALKKYNGNIPILQHFSKYTKYCVQMYLRAERSIENREMSLDKLLEMTETGYVSTAVIHCEAYGFFTDILELRSSLCPIYQKALDDAFNELDRRDEFKDSVDGKLPPYRYKEAKQVFKMVLRFLLK